MKSTAAIKKYAVEMTKANTDKRFRHKTCQYAGGGRFCTLTTNKKCTNCTFYDPTIPTVFHALADEISRAQTAKKLFDVRTNQLKGLISKIRTVEKDVERMQAETRKEYERLHIANYDLVQLWQDSVNTYE